MQKYPILTTIALSLILACLVAPLVIMASDISDAEYSGTIRVSNNGTSASNVFTTGNISTQNFIDAGYFYASSNNTAVRNASGADMAYMPATGNNTAWAFHVPTISANSYLNYTLYAGGTADMDGTIRYFPGAAGMTTTDNASLELGDNFTIEQRGWIDTMAVGANLTAKSPHSFNTWIASSGNISAGSPAYYSQETLTDGWSLYSGFRIRAGQRLNSFPAVQILRANISLYKTGSPSGTATINVRRVSDDGVIGTLGTIDVSQFTASSVMYSFTDMVTVPSSQDIRVLVEYSGGDGSNYIKVGSINSDVVANGSVTHYLAAYTDESGYDAQMVLYAGLPIVSAIGVASGEHTVRVEASPALSFNGTSDDINCGKDSSTNMTTNDYTVEAWVKTSSSAYQTILGRFDANDSGYILFLRNGNSLRWRNDDGDEVPTSYEISGTFTFNDDTWHHIVGTRTGGTGYIYADGALVTSGTLHATDIGNNNVDVTIGKRSDGSSWYFDGLLDEVRVYSRALALPEISYNYSQGRSGVPQSQTNLVGWWRMNENTGVTVADSSGNGNTGTITTADWAMPLDLYIDNALTDTDDGIGITGVPDTSDNWTFAESAAMPYMEYHEITIGGVQRQYIEWENAATFSDASGNGNSATPTFRTDSSDADVTATLIDFLPITQAQAPIYSANASGSMITAPPATPTTWIASGNITLPGAALINGMLDEGGVPRQLFWIPATFFQVVLFGAGIFFLMRRQGSLLIKAVVMGVLLGFFAFVGVYSFWVVPIFGFQAAAITIASKKLGW